MADIRVTGLIDNFDRADENPLQLPWKRDWSTHVDTRLQNNGITGTAFPPTGSQMYWSTEDFSGDIEMWAIAAGNAAQSDGWRFGFFTSGTSPSGYICLPHNNVGTDTWNLRRYDSGGFGSISNPAFALPVQGEICLMKLTASAVEVWKGNDTGDTWDLMITVADTTYRNNLYIALGTTGTGPGWMSVGGGLELDFIPQIYRRPNE